MPSGKIKYNKMLASQIKEGQQNKKMKPKEAYGTKNIIIVLNLNSVPVYVV